MDIYINFYTIYYITYIWIWFAIFNQKPLILLIFEKTVCLSSWNIMWQKDCSKFKLQLQYLLGGRPKYIQVVKLSKPHLHLNTVRAMIFTLDLLCSFRDLIFVSWFLRDIHHHISFISSDRVSFGFIPFTIHLEKLRFFVNWINRKDGKTNPNNFFSHFYLLWRTLLQEILELWR